ncbi:MAG: hypothetical protein ACLFQ0_19385 [Cyclobacteriaceae bacterium]
MKNPVTYLFDCFGLFVTGRVVSAYSRTLFLAHKTAEDKNFKQPV